MYRFHWKVKHSQKKSFISWKNSTLFDMFQRDKSGCPDLHWSQILKILWRDKVGLRASGDTSVGYLYIYMAPLLVLDRKNLIFGLNCYILDNYIAVCLYVSTSLVLRSVFFFNHCYCDKSVIPADVIKAYYIPAEFSFQKKDSMLIQLY